MDCLKFTYIPTSELAEFLIPFESPLMEIEIIKRFFEFTPGTSSNTELFSMHFSVFNALYRLKEDYGGLGYYVHIDPMRIRVLKIPESGCGYYFDDKGSFCTAESPEGEYCHVHRKFSPGNSVQIDFLRDFYIDPENISFGESELLKRILEGTFRFIKNRRQIEDAKKLFGISHPSKKIIRKKYRELAMKFHPDKNRGDEKPMKKLNEAYEVLREVYVI